MAIPTKRLDGLDPTVNPQRDHEVAAMRDAVSNKLRIEQILALLQRSDIPDAAVTLAKLADDARDASNHTFDDTTAQLGETDVQGAIEAVAAVAGFGVKITRYESSGAHTFDPNCVAAIIDLVGGGAGGRSANSPSESSPAAGPGGGSGADFSGVITDFDGVDDAVIVIGAGGSASSAGSASSYDDGVNEVSCPGGVVGDMMSSSTMSTGASPSDPVDPDVAAWANSVLLANGQGAQSPVIIGANSVNTSTVLAKATNGGSTRFGVGGLGGVRGSNSSANTPGGNGSGFGSGGGGAAAVVSSSAAGGLGRPGLCVVTEFIRRPL